MKIGKIQSEILQVRRYQCYDLDIRSMREVVGQCVMYQAPLIGVSDRKIPIKVSVVIDGKLYWIGPDPDCYVVQNERLIAVKFFDSYIFWSESLIFETDVRDAVRLRTLLEERHTPGELIGAITGSNNPAQERYTDLRAIYRKFGFTPRSSDAQPLIKILKWEFADAVLTLHVAKQDLSAEIEILVDVETRQVIEVKMANANRISGDKD